MGFTGKIYGLFLLFACVAGTNAFAQIDCAKTDETVKAFQKFQGITDSQISSDCTYGGKRARFTSDCVKGFEKMRGLSADYLQLKKEFCEKVTRCKAGDCPVSVEELAKETQSVHEKASALLAKGRDEIRAFRLKAQRRHRKCGSDKDELDEMAAASTNSDYSSVWKSPRMRRHRWKRSSKNTGSAVTAEQSEAPQEGEIVSDISGTDSDLIDAGAIGAVDLAEYREALPRFLGKQKRAIEKMTEFESEAFGVEERHEEAGVVAGNVPRAVSAQTLNAPIPNAVAAQTEAKKADAYVAVTGLEMPEKEEAPDFSGSLGDGGNPSHLKDDLRKMLAGESVKKGVSGAKKSTADFVAEIMADQSEKKNQESREPASAGNLPGSGPVDVAGAVREIEYQLSELDREHGILGPSGLTLFERVRQSYARYRRQYLGAH